MIIFENTYKNTQNFIEKIINIYNIHNNTDILIWSTNNITIKNLNQQQIITRKNYKKHLTKIFYTEEPTLDDKASNYIIGFIPEWIKQKYIQLRIFERNELQKTKTNQFYFNIYHNLNQSWKFKEKSKFCCFIVSNHKCKLRNNLFNLLSKYKHIDSMGKYMKNCNILDNIGRCNQEYYNIINQYKFIICCENVSKPFYLTEKIYNAFKSSTIPIYWGDPLVKHTFNKKTFIYIPTNDDPNIQNDYIKKTINKIIELDNNDDKYKEMFNHKPVLNPTEEDTRVQNSILKIANILQ